MFFRDRFKLPFASASLMSCLYAKIVTLIVAVPVSLMISATASAGATTCTDPSDPNCLCKPDILPFPNNKVKGPDGGVLPIVLEADSVESDGKDKITLKGKAFVAQGRQSISGDKVEYDRENDQVKADGNVKMRSVAGDQITADSFNLDVDTSIGKAKNATFKLATRGEITEETNAVLVQSRGSAKHVSIEGEDFVRLKDAVYTNCVEGQDDFLIKASELELDRATGQGTAKNAKFVFHGVPFFYLPRFTFPISDERKTGFLFPSIGRNSESGFIFEAPWYWNIAPNADATFTPRLLADRGVQIAAEVRHISQNSETDLNIEVLPSDDKFNDETRSLYSLDHEYRFTEKLKGRLDLNDVSDVEYFRDFRSDVDLFSTTYTPSEARLDYTEENWSLSARTVTYQVVDSDGIDANNTPFDVLPQINFNSRYRNIFGSGLNFSAPASYTSFERDFISTEGVNVEESNSRFTFIPSIERPFENVWGYITPKLSVNHASYSEDDIETRTAPVFSLDSGVYLERRIKFAGENALQTLEPRIFYVNSDSDTANTQNFDTRNLGFNNFNDLFSETGFTGGDGLADGQRVTLALASRIFDNEGTQKLKIQAGQVFFLDDLTTTENGLTTTQDKSDTLLEVDYQVMPALDLGVFLGYGQDIKELRNVNVDINYEPSKDNYFKFAYRLNKQLQADSTLSEESQFVAQAGLRLSPRWKAYATQRYDLDASENIQTQLGAEYDACCWRLRLTGDRLRRGTDDFRNALFAEIEFTSIGSFTTSF